MKIIFSNVKYKNTQSESWVQLAALSNDCVKKLGLETIFFGDEKSLKEYKNIKYDHFELIPENEIKQFPPFLWSMGKLITFKKINEPCVHIDQDILLNINFDINFFNNDIICLHDEKFATENMEILQALFNGKKPLESLGDTISYNCGLIGGNDYKSLQDSIDIIFNYLIDNYEFLKYINNKYMNFKNIQYLFYPPVLVEQIWLFQIINNYLNKKVHTLISEPTDWVQTKEFLFKKGVLHLMKEKNEKIIKEFINKIVKNINITY